MQKFDAIIDYIFRAGAGSATPIGDKLVQAANKKIKPAIEEQAVKDNDYLSEVNMIKTYDVRNDACWIDYRSWCIMSPTLRHTITIVLHPKMWRGAVFEYSKFIENEHIVLQSLSTNVVLVLSVVDRKYRIFAIPLYKSYIDWLSPGAFRSMNDIISKNMIKTYGRSDHTVYILSSNGQVDTIPLSIN